MKTDGSQIPEETRTVWDALDRLAPEPMPSDASARIEDALEKAMDTSGGRGAFPMGSKRRLAAALVAALLAGGVAGFGIGTHGASGPSNLAGGALPGDSPPADAAPTPDGPSAPDLPRYLLLVHDNEAVERAVREQGIDAIVERYAAWARELDERGRLVRAEKLTETPRWIGEGAPITSRISGFFLLRADDEAEALQIARTSPHVELGGVLEVRRIDAVER